MGSWSSFGDIDFATAPTFRADLCAMIDAAETDPVIVNCSSVTFMDSTGYHALVAANAHARAGHRTLVISGLPGLYVRVINFCDWDHELTLLNSSDRSAV